MTTKNTARRVKGDRLLASTENRGFSDQGHRPPSGKHARGKLGDLKWVGTSRVVDRAAKRKASRKSWAKIIHRAKNRPNAKVKETE